MPLFRLKSALHVILIIGFVILLCNIKILKVRYDHLLNNAQINSKLRSEIDPKAIPLANSIINIGYQVTNTSLSEASNKIQEAKIEDMNSIYDQPKIPPLTWTNNVSLILAVLLLSRLLMIIGIYHISIVSIVQTLRFSA